MCEDCEILGWWWLLLRGWFVLFETAGSLSLCIFAGKEELGQRERNSQNENEQLARMKKERRKSPQQSAKERIVNKATNKEKLQLPLIAIEGQCKRRGPKEMRDQEFLEHQTLLA